MSTPADELLTAAAIADRVGLSRANVSNWILARRLLPRGTVFVPVKSGGKRLLNTYSLADGQRLAAIFKARKETLR